MDYIFLDCDSLNNVMSWIKCNSIIFYCLMLFYLSIMLLANILDRLMIIE